MPDEPPSDERRTWWRWLLTWRTVVLIGGWLLLSALAASWLFLHSSRTVVVAGHDAVVSPTLDGTAVLRTGPVLPDLRTDSGGLIGIDIYLGKTESTITTDGLIERYALIAANPESQVDKLAAALTDMALAAALRGLVVGAIPVGLWLLVGAERRRVLGRRVRTREAAVVGVALVVAVVTVWQPWDRAEEDTTTDAADWRPLQDFLGPSVPVPSEASGIEVRGDSTTLQTRRLVESVVDTYDKSKRFYGQAATAAEELELRRPGDGEVTVLFVSDRHDNIGMDPVARVVGERAGATGVFGGGDDTSTGKPFEAFSLDSMTDSLGDLGELWAVTGNHDSGTFVGDYLADRGWTMLNGEVVPGPGGGSLLGIPDPRSSGLGSWVDSPGVTKEDAAAELADIACDAGGVDTLLVHDATFGAEALRRGCVTLVVGGHAHNVSGPTEVTGENGEVGWTFTNGTTGGAAYAVAVGSKLRRPADMTVLTYREGVPVGLQNVTLGTNGRFVVHDYVELGAADEGPDVLP